MAVKVFRTNDLVKEHDQYVELLKKRLDYLKEKGWSTSSLFPKGLKEYIGVDKSDHCYPMKKWHCIVLTYDIWYYIANKYHDAISNTPISSYKAVVDISTEHLKVFKFKVEEAIKDAKCDYNMRKTSTYKFDACRYLAMFWTYLDIIKDEKTQRFFPNKETRERAAKVFGYENGENPFEMNGKYWKEEEESVEEKETSGRYPYGKSNTDISNTPIEELDFSVRTYNVLKRALNDTVGDLLMKTTNDLIKTRNMGINSIREIKGKLRDLGYEYPNDENSCPRKIESVIDIAEQAAKEVEEERAMPEPPLRELREAYNEARDDYNRLLAKYDELLKKAREGAEAYDELLKQKLELESANAKLRDDILILKERNEALQLQARPKTDILAILTVVVSLMKRSNMSTLKVTIDGITVDIHPKNIIKDMAGPDYRAYINGKEV